MNVQSINLPLYEVAKKYLTKQRINIEKILDEEIEIITKIRVTLTWLKLNASITIRETIVQKIFTLYCSGLLQKISNYDIYAINSIYLEAVIETANNLNQRCKNILSGKADVVIGEQLKDQFDIADKSKVLKETTIIGEIKPCFGSLYMCKSKIGDSTNQLLAPTSSKMRKEVNISNQLVKGVLSDCFFIRLAFRYVIAKGKTFYAISSLYDTPMDFVLSIIVLISDITVEDICGVEGSIINEDEEEDMPKCVETDFDGDKSFPREKLFVTKNREDGNKMKGNSKSYGTNRQPLKTMNSNIIYIGEDPLVEERRADLQNLAEWEACRLGRTYLNASNLRLLDK